MKEWHGHEYGWSLEIPCHNRVSEGKECAWFAEVTGSKILIISYIATTEPKTKISSGW